MEQGRNTATLFDLSGQQFNSMWVDENQPLFIPNNPLHYRAHKLQVLLERLDKQATKNPAQFNSRNYIDALNEYTKCVNEIKNGVKYNEVLDEGAMETSGNEGAAPIYRHIEPVSMDS